MWPFKQKKSNTLTVKIDASDVHTLIKDEIKKLCPELKRKMAEVKDINRRLSLPDTLKGPLLDYEKLLDGLIELGRERN